MDMNKLVKRNMILLESMHLFHGGLRICDIFKFINKTYLFTELLGEHFKSWKTFVVLGHMHCMVL